MGNILAHELTDASPGVLTRLDLDVSRPQCNNFLIAGGNRETNVDIEGDKRNTKRKLQEQTKFGLNQALDRIQGQEEKQKQQSCRLNGCIASSYSGWYWAASGTLGSTR